MINDGRVRFGRWKRRCQRCRTWTPRSWWVPAGGLCADCLADAALPLTRFNGREAT